ncbi:MAG: DUF2007 domain-containing protein [Bacteroidales bacterium]|nr:DUF2007 domain-containing protein [Bacteroidales bacterium]MBN2819141.1 DUF2007 domain-containing protein [Bacteroidales bacterium]
MNTRTLLICNNIQEAHILKGRLANEGIPALVANDNFTNLLPVYNGMLGAGIQILVYEEDWDKASKLLKINDFAESCKICPNCGSANIKFGIGRNSTIKFFGIILSLLAFIPFGNIRGSYYCKDCHTEFTG